MILPDPLCGHIKHVSTDLSMSLRYWHVHVAADIDGEKCSEVSSPESTTSTIERRGVENSTSEMNNSPSVNDVDMVDDEPDLCNTVGVQKPPKISTKCVVSELLSFLQSSHFKIKREMPPHDSDRALSLSHVRSSLLGHPSSLVVVSIIMFHPVFRVRVMSLRCEERRIRTKLGFVFNALRGFFCFTFVNMFTGFEALFCPLM